MLLDEKDARLVARELGLPVRGTLGSLVEAKRGGFVSAVAPLIEHLRASGGNRVPCVDVGLGVLQSCVENRTLGLIEIVLSNRDEVELRPVRQAGGRIDDETTVADASLQRDS